MYKVIYVYYLLNHTRKVGSQMRKFYHLSLSLTEGLNKVCSPRVPNDAVRMKGEEGTIPRICVCDSIEGCLTAVPFGGANLADYFVGDNHPHSCPIRVFVFDEKDILEGNLITPDELYEKDWVRDAFYSNEHWIVNQDIKPVDTFVISVVDYEESIYDNVSPVNRELYDNCVNGDLEQYIEGHITVIENVFYKILNDYVETDYLTIVFNEKIEEENLDFLRRYFESLSYDSCWFLEVEFTDESRECVVVSYDGVLNISLDDVKDRLIDRGFSIHSIY